MPSALCRISSIPRVPSSSANSRCLPALALASTTRLASAVLSTRGPSDTERLSLQRAQLADAGCGQVEQRIELMAPEGMPFSRALNLDERAAVVHDDVHVGLSFG